MDHRLFDAARSGDMTTLQLLLQEDPLLLERFSMSSLENPLHVSAFSGQVVFTEEILRRKQDLALEPNQQGFTPLHIASASGTIEVVRVLIMDNEWGFLVLSGLHLQLHLYLNLF
ncbi:hypothetical protein Bca52824_049747 [Brassica carinata]|uniref:Uncharacterized protein n=1 Tax=Brassica carinata TaxID=52824 RepID=A0A8X7RLD8_BRACI|nr:hypothetical protein Bca52824_049747 [Brassica carinata]